MFKHSLAQARQLRKDQGFTLIELLIVIVVLGILAGIVVFGVGTFKSDSEAAAKKADCKTVEVAAEAWSAKNGSYPAGVAELVTAKYLKAAPASGVGTTISSAGVISGC